MSWFQFIAIGQSKSEKGGQALKTLEQQYLKCKNNFPEAEKNLAVALVEVFMLQVWTKEKLIYFNYYYYYKDLLISVYLNDIL